MRKKLLPSCRSKNNSLPCLLGGFAVNHADVLFDADAYAAMPALIEGARSTLRVQLFLLGGRLLTP